MAAGLRLRRAGDHRGGRTGQGAEDRAHCPRSGRTGPVSGFALSLHHRLHQPGGHCHPGSAVRGPPRGRLVQRGHRVPARLRLPARRRALAGVAGSRRPEPPHLGALGVRGRRGRAARTAGQARGPDRAAHRDDRGLHPAPGHGAVVLPALLLRSRRGGRVAARRDHPGRGSRPAGDRTPGPVRGSGAGHQAAPAGPARRRVVLRSGGGPARLADRRPARYAGR